MWSIQSLGDALRVLEIPESLIEDAQSDICGEYLDPEEERLVCEDEKMARMLMPAFTSDRGSGTALQKARNAIAQGVRSVRRVDEVCVSFAYEGSRVYSLKGVCFVEDGLGIPRYAGPLRSILTLVDLS
jgi:hypothetical protein